MEIIVCSICGTEFTKKRYNQKFCRPLCQRRNQSRVWLKQNPEKAKRLARESYNRNKERIKKSREATKEKRYEQTKKWKEQNAEYYSKKNKEYCNRISFDGKREIIIERDNYKCRNCGTDEKLIVHHIDENRNNNKLENLITWCRGCHCRHHKPQMARWS